MDMSNFFSLYQHSSFRKSRLDQERLDQERSDPEQVLLSAHLKPSLSLICSLQIPSCTSRGEALRPNPLLPIGTHHQWHTTMQCSRTPP